MKLFLAVALSCLCCATAYAEGVAATYDIDSIRVDDNGKGYVKFTTNLVGTPAACATSTYAAALGFDANTAGGQAILATVLSAQASGKKIYAKGTNDCTTYNVIEDWSWGYIKS